jgi:hypothetical protein
MKFALSVALLVTVFAPIVLADVQELYWDDGVPYVPYFFLQPGNGWAVLFEPPGGGQILQAKVYIGNPPGNTTFEGCMIALYYDNSGTPASFPFWGPTQFADTQVGWNYYAINVHCNGGKFYVLWIQVGYEPNCDAVYCDPSYDNFRSYKYLNGVWYPFDGYGDLMIRCYYDYYPGVELNSLGQVKALFN